MLFRSGKHSEFHAAMGLCVLPRVGEIIEARKQIFELYDCILNWDKLVKPVVNQQVETNYAYYPIFLESEEKLIEVRTALEAKDIFPRRYFYPSLSSLKFVIAESNCPIADDFAPRALALPLYYDLAHEDVRKIANIVNSCL